MTEITVADSAANFLARQGIGRFSICSPGSAHRLIAGDWYTILTRFACIVVKHVFPSEFLRFA